MDGQDVLRVEDPARTVREENVMEVMTAIGAVRATLRREWNICEVMAKSTNIKDPRPRYWAAKKAVLESVVSYLEVMEVTASAVVMRGDSDVDGQ